MRRAENTILGKGKAGLGDCRGKRLYQTRIDHGGCRLPAVATATAGVFKSGAHSPEVLDTDLVSVNFLLTPHCLGGRCCRRRPRLESKVTLSEFQEGDNSVCESFLSPNGSLTSFL